MKTTKEYIIRLIGYYESTSFPINLSLSEVELFEDISRALEKNQARIQLKIEPKRTK